MSLGFHFYIGWVLVLVILNGKPGTKGVPKLVLVPKRVLVIHLSTKQHYFKGSNWKTNTVSQLGLKSTSLLNNIVSREVIGKLTEMEVGILISSVHLQPTALAHTTNNQHVNAKK